MREEPRAMVAKAGRGRQGGDGDVCVGGVEDERTGSDLAEKVEGRELVKWKEVDPRGGEGLTWRGSGL